MRNIAMLLSATLIFLSILPVTASAQGKELTFTVDGKPLKFAYGKPFTDLNGRLQVPIQQIGRALGASVTVVGDEFVLIDVPATAFDPPPNENDSSITEYRVCFYVGEKHFTIGEPGEGFRYEMDAKTTISSGLVYAPIRYVVESLGASLQWNRTANTIKISSGKYRIPLFDFEHPRGSFDKKPVPYYTVNAAWTVPKNTGINYKTFGNDPEKDYAVYVDLTTYSLNQQVHALKADLGSQLNADIAEELVESVEHTVTGYDLGSASLHRWNGKKERAIEVRKFPGSLWSVRPIIEIIIYKDIPDKYKSLLP